MNRILVTYEHRFGTDQFVVEHPAALERLQSALDSFNRENSSDHSRMLTFVREVLADIDFEPDRWEEQLTLNSLEIFPAPDNAAEALERWEKELGYAQDR